MFHHVMNVGLFLTFVRIHPSGAVSARSAAPRPDVVPQLRGCAAAMRRHLLETELDALRRAKTAEN